MNFRNSMVMAGVSLAALSGPGYAAGRDEPAQAAETPGKKPLTAWQASRIHQDDGMVATGVARARDKLDSATSTSALTENDIVKIAPTSLGDLYRNIPGLRVEAGLGESNANYTIRGLPLVSTGSKYLQLQEDGLPVLEYGDILGFSPDTFLRADFNVGQVESIRGGSASTFASNAPGGVINLISQTGEVEGGSVQVSSGLDFQRYRSDFDYGGRLSDTLRFHFGGFYREGAGPRHPGYTADRGGQVKANITKEFAGGYVRLYAKLLNDRNAYFSSQPVAITGTNDNPTYQNITGFSVNKASLLSRNITTIPTLDGNNQLVQFDPQEGLHVKSTAIGLEAKFTLGEWSVSNAMRYADQSGSSSFIIPLGVVPAAAVTTILGVPGATLVYASGPRKGQTITDPATLNGNGLVALSAPPRTNLNSLNNFTDDLRISRVWTLASGALTSTVGIYGSHQDVDFDSGLSDIIQDVAGDGNSALIDVIKANGVPLTQNGVLDYSGPYVGLRSNTDVSYRVLAPYGSLNFRAGKISVGGSVRVDTGKVEGRLRTNTPTDVMTIDVNNDGVISDAERTFAYAAFSNTTPVNYTYGYVSYSGSVNYRLSQSMSTFARYSKGAKAGAERILFSPAINRLDGSLVNKTAEHDPVKQTEVGFKFRRDGMFLNATAFLANVSETNIQLQPSAGGAPQAVLVVRSYRAYGGEFEGGVRYGPFSLNGSATVTKAEITAAENPALVGKTPRHQAAVIYQVSPQYDTDLFTVGANVVGTTWSYTQDVNQLRMPAFATVGLFLQVRPMERVQLSLNANNLFDTKAFTDVSESTVPMSGVGTAQTLYGRTITAAFRVFF